RFLERLRDIHAHPDTPSQDELLLCDGRTIERVSAPIRGEDGRHYGRVWFFREITARIHEMQFVDSIVENIPHMVFVKDAEDLKFVRFNRAGEELVGHKREDLLGKSDHDFFPPEQAKAFIDNDRAVLAQRSVSTVEEPIDTRDGKRWLRTKKIPILGKRGEPLYLLGISEDIT